MSRQTISESSYKRDDIADIGIIITSRNCAGKIMRPIRMTNRPSPTSSKVLFIKQIQLDFRSSTSSRQEASLASLPYPSSD